MVRVVLEPTFVLHTRAFQDTSSIVELFTMQHGRVAVVARGARSAKSKLRGLLLPFVPLFVSWSGKSELKTLGKTEAANLAYSLIGANLLSGFYLNELLVRLLTSYDPCCNLYKFYQHTLEKLQINKNPQAALRLFEKKLLAEIGYGLQLTKDVDGEAINVNEHYYYQHERGFVKCGQIISRSSTQFSGKTLLALYKDEFVDNTELQECKLLMRLVFSHLLGGRQLKSRELFWKD